MSSVHPQANGTPPAYILDPRKPDVDEEGRSLGPAISAKFFVGPDPSRDMHDNDIVDREGNVPTIEMVEIINRNDPKNSPMVQRATDLHRFKRFPHEYRLFQEGRTSEMSGISLKEWLGDNARTQKLAQYNIYTAEQLAVISDSLCQTLGPGHLELRRKAQAHLDATRDTAAVERERARNDVLERQLREMQEQIARLAKANGSDLAREGTEQDLDEVHPAEQEFVQPRRKPGRPARTQEGN